MIHEAQDRPRTSRRTQMDSQMLLKKWATETGSRLNQPLCSLHAPRGSTQRLPCPDEKRRRSSAAQRAAATQVASRGRMWLSGPPLGRLALGVRQGVALLVGARMLVEAPGLTTRSKKLLITRASLLGARTLRMGSCPKRTEGGSRAGFPHAPEAVLWRSGRCQVQRDRPSHRLSQSSVFGTGPCD